MAPPTLYHCSNEKVLYRQLKHEQHNKQGVNASSVREPATASKFRINQELCQTLNHIYKSNLEPVKFLQGEARGEAMK